MNPSIQIKNNISIIIENNMSWSDAVSQFDLHDLNLQKVYLRYIIKEYGYMKALLLIQE